MSEGMPPLDSKLRSLVEAERAAEDLSPPADKLDQVGGRLWASLGLAGVPPAVVGVGASAAAGKAAATSAAATAATAAKAATSAGAGKVAAAAAGGATVAGGAALVLKSVIVAAAFGTAALTTYLVVGPKREAAAPAVAGSGSGSGASGARSVSPASPDPARHAPSTTRGVKSLAAPGPAVAAPVVAAPTPTATVPGGAASAAKAGAKAAAIAAAARAPASTKRASSKLAAGSASGKGPAVEPAAAALATSPAARSSTIGAERSLLERARAALSGGKSDVAMALLEIHRRRYRTGALAEEREALTIMVLAKRGQLARARAQARVFHQRHPSSLLRRAIERALISGAKK